MNVGISENKPNINVNVKIPNTTSHGNDLNGKDMGYANKYIEVLSFNSNTAIS